jgi:hypothetical protein
MLTHDCLGDQFQSRKGSHQAGVLLIQRVPVAELS